MTHFFERANGRLFSGRLAEDAEYQPRRGGNYPLLKADGQGVVRGSADEMDLGGLGQGAAVGRISLELPAAALRDEPVEGDRIRIGTSSFRISSWKRATDDLVMKLTVSAL